MSKAKAEGREPNLTVDLKVDGHGRKRRTPNAER